MSLVALLLTVLMAVGTVEGQNATLNGDCTTATCDTNLACQSNVCKSYVGQACTADSTNECVAGSAACPPAGGTLKCSCDTNFLVNSDMSACSALMGTPCTTNSPCVDSTMTCTAGSSGSAGLCFCPDDKATTYNRQTCVNKVGDSCATGACPTNAACTSSVCACNSGFTASSDNKQCVKLVDAACTMDSECPLFATCTVGTCTCTAPLAKSADGTCDFSSGAASITASLLLMLVLSVTSRLQ